MRSARRPDFEDASEQEPTPAPVPPVVAPAAPEFEDAPPPLAPAASVAGSQVPTRRFLRLAQWIAGGVTLLSILAILLAIFLPRERPTARRAQGPQSSTPAAVQNPASAGSQQAQWPASAQQAPGSGIARQPMAVTSQGQTSAPVGGYQAPQQTSGAAPTGAQGTRYVTCPDCGGTGQVACPIKHLPNGHMLNPLFWQEERYYSGSDPLLPDDADMGECPVCHGTYKTRCRYCNGQGQILEGAPRPQNPFPELGGLSGVDPEMLKSLTGQLGGAE